MLAVSAKSGQGIAELRLRITEILQSLPLKAVDPPFRMPVDRVFTLEGFGTVATGTVTHGEFQTGDTLQAFPSGEKLRIRGIESQHVPVESVSVGQRAAVNVRGKVKRGDVLADPETLRATVRIDVRLRLIRGTKREITTGTRLHFYTGTSSTLCRVVLLDRDHLAAGEECFAQLRLESPAACLLYTSRSEPVQQQFLLRYLPWKARVARGGKYDIPQKLPLLSTRRPSSRCFLPEPLRPQRCARRRKVGRPFARVFQERNIRFRTGRLLSGFEKIPGVQIFRPKSPGSRE